MGCNSMKLMLVEDEYLLNKAIKSYLVSKGFRVESFTDGLEALASINNAYDIFILDIDIPQLSGIELLEKIRQVFPTTPVIIISATIDMDMITKAYTKGCNDYLKKPFDIKELELKIKALTRSYESEVVIKDSLVYNKDKQLLSFEKKTIPLTVNEQMLLNVLLQNRGTVVSHELLESTIWDLSAEKTYLRQLVTRVRKKLPFDIIENHVGEGYVIE